MAADTKNMNEEKAAKEEAEEGKATGLTFASIDNEGNEPCLDVFGAPRHFWCYWRAGTKQSFGESL
jgi:hypothetical protein